MPAVTGRDASTGPVRDDIPLHEMVGGNTFVPDVLPHHPAFGGDVNAAILQETVTKATKLLRKAATLSLSLGGGNLTVRVTNESGHKLPTGYPDGRRMWLHVRAFDADRAVVFESGRYVFATADLIERYVDYDTAASGLRKSELQQDAPDEHRRNGRWAARQLVGSPRSTVELI